MPWGGGDVVNVGSTARILQPRLAPAVYQVTRLEAGRGFAWVTRSLGVTATADHRIEPAGEGSRVTLSVNMEGFLSRIFGPMMKKLTNEYLAIEAAGLKRRSEASE